MTEVLNNRPAFASFGEIMLRLDCPPRQRFQRNDHFRKFFGGAEANVSVVLSQLGIPTRYVSALPANDIGQSAIDAVRSFGVDTSFVYRRGERAGIYFTEHGNNVRSSNVIYDRKNSSFSTLSPGIIEWDKIFKDVKWFFWSGISAALTQNAADTCREAILAAKQRNIFIAADMNYRRTLWDYGKHPSEVMPELLSYCDSITGDIDTIEVYFGIPESKGSIEDKFRFCASGLKKKLPDMKALSMTFRGNDEHSRPTYSAALMYHDQFYFTPVYSIPQTVDRIGSGDAFQGGLLYGMVENMPAQQIINFAVACGAIKHSIEGDFTILTRQEVEQFIKTGPINKVTR